MRDSGAWLAFSMKFSNTVLFTLLVIRRTIITQKARKYDPVFYLSPKIESLYNLEFWVKGAAFRNVTNLNSSAKISEYQLTQTHPTLLLLTWKYIFATVKTYAITKILTSPSAHQDTGMAFAANNFHALDKNRLYKNPVKSQTSRKQHTNLDIHIKRSVLCAWWWSAAAVKAICFF